MNVIVEGATRMRMWLLLAFLVLGATGPAFAQEEDPAPLLVWMEIDEEGVHVPPGVPRLVLYEDGSILFVAVNSNDDGFRRFRRATIPEPEWRAVEEHLSALDMWESTYYVGSQGDGTTQLFGSRGTSGRGITVFGIRAHGSAFDEDRLRADDLLPEDLRWLLRYCASKVTATGEPWLPKFRIDLKPWDITVDPIVIEPAGWAAHEGPWPTKDGGFAMTVPGSELTALTRLHDATEDDERIAISIDGRLWTLRGWKPVFPGERVWKAGFPPGRYGWLE